MSKATKPSTPTSEKSVGKNQDVALICGKTDDGKGLHILRKRGSAIEAGIVQPLEEGKAIHGELVTLRQRGQTPVCDVEVHYRPQTTDSASTNQTASPAASSSNRGSSGARSTAASSDRRGHPAQVATDDYRKNWDAIWRSKTPKSTLLN